MLTFVLYWFLLYSELSTQKDSFGYKMYYLIDYDIDFENRTL